MFETGSWPSWPPLEVDWVIIGLLLHQDNRLKKIESAGQGGNGTFSSPGH